MHKTAKESDKSAGEPMNKSPTSDMRLGWVTSKVPKESQVSCLHDSTREITLGTLYFDSESFF